MRKLILFIATIALAESPDLASIETKRAEFWRLNAMQIQIALRIQDLRTAIQADVKKAGCTIDEALETRPVCTPKEKK